MGHCNFHSKWWSGIKLLAHSFVDVMSMISVSVIDTISSVLCGACGPNVVSVPCSGLSVGQL